MHIYLINLARRRDRLRAMAEQLSALGLAFERVPAFDADITSDAWLGRHFQAKGPLGAVAKGDKCCSLSHRRAWSAFLASGQPYGVVLEDDVALDVAAGSLLKRSDWIPRGVELLKLEHFGPRGQRVLLGEPMPVGAGRSIAAIHSRHTGAAAYIISREAAQTLTAYDEKWAIAVDHLLFNPNVSPLAGRLRPYQLLPVIARQTPALGGLSDIVATRAACRRLNRRFPNRALVRGFYEMRLLPQQVARVLRGRASLVRVENDALTFSLHSPDC